MKNASETQMLLTKLVVNCKIFNYWIEEKKTFFSDVSPKYCFLESIFHQKPTKTTNFHQKKCVEWFLYKN